MVYVKVCQMDIWVRGIYRSHVSAMVTGVGFMFSFGHSWISVFTYTVSEYWRGESPNSVEVTKPHTRSQCVLTKTVSKCLKNQISGTYVHNPSSKLRNMQNFHKVILICFVPHLSSHFQGALATYLLQATCKIINTYWRLLIYVRI